MSAFVILAVQGGVWGAIMWSPYFMSRILGRDLTGEEPAETQPRLPDYLSDLD
jgi:hypothetical protein